MSLDSKNAIRLITSKLPVKTVFNVMFTWGGLETIRVPKTKLPSFATKGPPQPYPGHRNSDKEKLKYEYWVK